MGLIEIQWRWSAKAQFTIFLQQGVNALTLWETLFSDLWINWLILSISSRKRVDFFFSIFWAKKKRKRKIISIAWFHFMVLINDLFTLQSIKIPALHINITQEECHCSHCPRKSILALLGYLHNNNNILLHDWCLMLYHLEVIKL
jgi:hypothetical protein